ncbi:hypothetical protein PV963_00305 [Streptomyces coeruleorubidus]|uniref:hypothetical protein n=1 Tax=Streptomyces coeruleorubidus TaxID=116188 RepID=UPI00237F9BA2|nr:hypothetical protein [Streptomyces coeruleorubidus]WDV49094.1 hypothetical protein PV963_00305 [Streptomyces coeruleorubidus]
MTPPVRVLTVDDQELVRTALRAMLRRTDVEVVGEAARGPSRRRTNRARTWC